MSMASRAHPAREVVPEERREALTKDKQGKGILWVRVDARAVEVEDVLNRVTHVIHGLRVVFEGGLKDFSENVRAYPRDLLLDGLYREIISNCRESV